MTHYEDPRELQVVWRWSHKERRPIEVQYLGRNRTWRKWRRGDHTWNENGCAAWYDNPVNCAWGHLEWLCLKPGSRRPASAWADETFAVCCEYVRQFSAQFNGPCSEVWEKGLKPENLNQASPPPPVLGVRGAAK